MQRLNNRVEQDTMADQYSSRTERIQEKLPSFRVDAVLISHLPNIQYLCGFTGSSGQLIVTREEVYFLSDVRYDEQAHQEVTNAQIRITSGKSITDDIIRLKILRNIARLGFEYDHIPYAHFHLASKKFLPAKLIGLQKFVEDLRLVKSAKELQLIKKAASITDNVFSDIVSLLKPGVTELDIAAEITYRHKKYGAAQDAFDPIVVSGNRTTIIHGQPSSKKIRRGEFVLLDFGCRVQGYNCDMTRTVAAGSPTSEMRKIYQAVREVQQRAIEAVRADMEAKKIDRTARKFLGTKNFETYFTHSTGHGIGLEVHEAPIISSKSSDILKNGMVITIEPGVYIPDHQGVRIEDDLFVTENGCEVLNSSSKEFIII